MYHLLALSVFVVGCQYLKCFKNPFQPIFIVCFIAVFFTPLSHVRQGLIAHQPVHAYLPAPSQKPVVQWLSLFS